MGTGAAIFAIAGWLVGLAWSVRVTSYYRGIIRHRFPDANREELKGARRKLWPWERTRVRPAVKVYHRRAYFASALVGLPVFLIGIALALRFA